MTRQKRCIRVLARTLDWCWYVKSLTTLERRPMALIIAAQGYSPKVFSTTLLACAWQMLYTLVSLLSYSSYATDQSPASSKFLKHSSCLTLQDPISESKTLIPGMHLNNWCIAHLLSCVPVIKASLREDLSETPPSLCAPFARHL